MEYNEIPAAIKDFKDEMNRCSYVIKHDIPRHTDANGSIKVSIGDRVVKVNAAALETFINNQMAVNGNAVERLEDIHETLLKVAVGLVK